MKLINTKILKRNACAYTNPYLNRCKSARDYALYYDDLESMRKSYNFNDPDLQLICDLIFAILYNTEAGLLPKYIICRQKDLKKYYKELIKFAQLEVSLW